MCCTRFCRTTLKVEKNQTEWRRRRQQWSQHGREVASVREDPDDRPPPPTTRLNRSVDIELGGASREEPVVQPPAPAPARHPAAARSFLGRSGVLPCRVLLLDGGDITVELEVGTANCLRPNRDDSSYLNRNIAHVYMACDKIFVHYGN